MSTSNAEIPESVVERTAYLYFRAMMELRRLEVLQFSTHDAETQTPRPIDVGTQTLYSDFPARGQIPSNPASPITSSGSKLASRLSSPSNPRGPVASNPESPMTSPPSTSPKRSPFADLPITRSPRPLANDLAFLQTPPPDLSRTATLSDSPYY